MLKKVIVFFFIISFFLIALPAFAQSTSLKDAGCLVGGSNQVATIECIPTIILNVIKWLFLVAGFLALFFIILSGFKFVTSGGEPKKAEGARKTLTFAIIGLVVVLLSFGIVATISKLTGLNTGCLTQIGFAQCLRSSPLDCPSGTHRQCKSGNCRCIPN